MNRSRLKPRFATHNPLPAVLVVLLLFLPACQRRSQSVDQAPEIDVQLAIEPMPATTGETTLIITLSDGTGQPVPGAQVEVRGDMTHAGMVPVLATAAEAEPGRYQAPFEWTMAGDWIVTISAELEDGRLLERTFERNVGSEGEIEMEMQMDGS